MPDLAGRACAGAKRKSQMGHRALKKMDEWIATNSIEPPASTAAKPPSRCDRSREARNFRRRHQHRPDARRSNPTPPANPTPILERSRITRLGKGVDRTGRLDQETSRLTLDTIAEFAEAARAAGAEKIIAAATSALRDATDGADFIQRVKEAAGVDLKVIPGSEEAELSRLAVKRSLNLKFRLAPADRRYRRRLDRTDSLGARPRPRQRESPDRIGAADGKNHPARSSFARGNRQADCGDRSSNWKSSDGRFVPMCWSESRAL